MAGAAAGGTITASSAVILQSVLRPAVRGVTVLIIVAEVPFLARQDRLTATPTNRLTGLDDRLALLPQTLMPGTVASGVSGARRRHRSGQGVCDFAAGARATAQPGGQ